MNILGTRPNLLYLIVKMDFESVCDFVLTGSINARKTLFAHLANITNLYRTAYRRKMLLIGVDLLVPISSNNNTLSHIFIMNHIKYRLKK